MVVGPSDLGSPQGTLSEKQQQVLQIAKRVAWEYQLQLWEDTYDPSKVSCRATAYDTVGILHLDQVMASNKSDEKPYLSTQQWTDLNTIFSDQGRFGKVTSLVIATSSPIGMIADKGSDAAKKFADNKALRESWAMGHYTEEQLEFIKLVEKWLLSGTNREVIVACGSLGFGCHVTVSSNAGNKRIFSQVISSPITATPAPFAQDVAQMLQGKQQTLGEGFSSSCTDFCFDVNFGIINITMEQGKKPVIENWIIRPSVQQPTSVENSWINKAFVPVDDGSGCCIVM
jgi:hypothetical protein